MIGRVLVTGASGFVGGAVVERLARDHAVVACSRNRVPLAPGVAWEPGPDFENYSGGGIPAGVEAVVHLAAVAHLQPGADDAARDRILAVNARAPVAFARAAHAAGARRFVFLSSIKAVGEVSARPFTAATEPRPADVYGYAKLAAERGLRDLAHETGMEVAIVRPPLVYGAGVKANFRQLVSWIQRRRPLPLALANNRRSLVSVWNLADLLARCTVDPRAAGGVWHVADGPAMTTAELAAAIARAASVRPRLWAVPPALATAVLKTVGRGGMAQRLFAPLEVDDAETRRCLDWTPPVSVDEALVRTVRSLQ